MYHCVLHYITHDIWLIYTEIIVFWIYKPVAGLVHFVLSHIFSAWSSHLTNSSWGPRTVCHVRGQQPSGDCGYHGRWLHALVRVHQVGPLGSPGCWIAGAQLIMVQDPAWLFYGKTRELSTNGHEKAIANCGCLPEGKMHWLPKKQLIIHDSWSFWSPGDRGSSAWWEESYCTITAYNFLLRRTDMYICIYL